MTPDQRRRGRNRAMRLAIGTSLVARVSGVALQIFSLPFAAAALGTQAFALYAMLAAIMSWLMLSNLGIGQAITLRIAQARGRDDEAAVRALLATGARLVLALSLGVAVVVLAIAVLTPADEALFRAFPGWDRQIVLSLGFVLAAFAALLNLGLIEATQLAFQQQHRFNLFTAAGTLAAAVAVVAIARGTPTPLAILAAVHLPPIALRLANAALFLRANRLPWPGRGGGAPLRPLLGEGLGFLSAGSLSNFLCHPFAILAVGAFAAPAETAALAAVMNAVLLSTSAFAMITIPFRGAVPEAAAQHDTAWIRRMYRSVLAGNVGLGLVVLGLFAGVGGPLFAVWYRGSVAPGALMLTSAGLYVLLMAVEAANFSFLTSLGRVRLCAGWLAAKGVLSAGAVTACAAAGRPDLAFVAMTGASILMSTIPLTLAMTATADPPAVAG